MKTSFTFIFLLACVSLWSQNLTELSYQTIDSFANKYYQNGAFDKAIPYMQAGREKARIEFGEMDAVFAQYTGDLGFFYDQLGQYHKAEPLYLQAIAKNIWGQALGEQHPNFSAGLNNLANLYKNIGELDTALLYCGQSIAALSDGIDVGFNDWANLDKFKYISNIHINRSISTLLAILNEQYKKTGQKNILELYYQTTQAAMRLNERVRNDFIGESDKLRSLETSNVFVLQGIKTAIGLAKRGYQQEAFGFAEMNKGVLLMDAAKAEKAFQFGELPDSLALLEKQLQKKHTYLEAKLLEKSAVENKSELLKDFNKVKQEIADFTKILKTNFPKYLAVKYENKTASTSDIQAVLSDKMALLEYVVSDSVLYVFYLDKKQVGIIELEIRKDSLALNIKKLHQALSNHQTIKNNPHQAYDDYTQMAYWFYKNTLQEVLSYAVGIQHLVIIPDGELGHLPFEIFLMEPAPALSTKEESSINYANLHYLLKDYKISYGYSATLWKENTETKNKANNGKIMGVAAN